MGQSEFYPRQFSQTERCAGSRVRWLSALDSATANPVELREERATYATNWSTRRLAIEATVTV